MGSPPLKSSLNEGITAALKRTLDSPEDEQYPPTKRRDSLTPSNSPIIQPTTTLGNPSPSTPQISANENTSFPEATINHDGTFDMAVDPYTEGSEFEPPSHPNLKTLNSTETKSNRVSRSNDNSLKVKKVTFKNESERKINKN